MHGEGERASDLGYLFFYSLCLAGRSGCSIVEVDILWRVLFGSRNKISGEYSCCCNSVWTPSTSASFVCLNGNSDLTFSVIDGSGVDSVKFTSLAFGTKTKNFLELENIVPLPSKEELQLFPWNIRTPFLVYGVIHKGVKSDFKLCDWVSDFNLSCYNRTHLSR